MLVAFFSSFGPRHLLIVIRWNSLLCFVFIFNVRPRQMDSSCCFASLFFQFLGSVVDYTPALGTWWQQTYFFVSFFVLFCWIDGLSWRLRWLLQVTFDFFSVFVIMLSLLTISLSLLLFPYCSCLPRLIQPCLPPNWQHRSLFFLITALIPLHGWRFEMNKLSSESNRWQSPSFVFGARVAAFHLWFGLHAMKENAREDEA